MTFASNKHHLHVENYRFCFTIVTLCTIWYLASSSANIVNKIILDKFPFPLTVAMSSLLGTSLYSLPLLRQLSISHAKLSCKYLLIYLVPLALGKIIAVASSYVSLWKVPLSYAHTVKATMPLFTVLCARLLLSEKQTLVVYLSLVPIVIGVVIASLTELSFNLSGLISALCSTFTYALLNSYVKKIIHFLQNIRVAIARYMPNFSLPDALHPWVTHARRTFLFENRTVLRDTMMHHVKLLSLSTQIACFIFFPFWFYEDVTTLWSDTFAAQESKSFVNLEIFFMLTGSGFLNFVQNMVTFTLIHKLSALSYSVANATKRLIIVVASLMILRNPVTPLNVFGMLLAALGVVLYNQAKQLAEKVIKNNNSIEKNGSLPNLPLSMSDPLFPDMTPSAGIFDLESGLQKQQKFSNSCMTKSVNGFFIVPNSDGDKIQYDRQISFVQKKSLITLLFSNNDCFAPLFHRSTSQIT
uniref:Sugar phosphate transporter domain-containing protein n=1 Tax=Romanomermis culicivorax TaxID=13658 RepID=A0A915JL00_ROMCU